MTRSLACVIVVLGSVALVACDSSEGDGSGGGGGGGATTSSTSTAATSTASTGGEGGEGGAGGGLADECPELNATEPCDSGGMRGCGEAEDGSGRLEWTECDETSGAASTPLVLSFDGAEATFHVGASAAFDLTGTGLSVGTDWPSAETPWLALDRDGDGRIGDGRELFGSAVKLTSGRLASHGFEALSELDANRDGRIDAADPRFAQLVVWADASGDRVSQPGEVARLETRSIVSISLAFSRTSVCDARGNCGIERATFTWLDARGTWHEGRVIDVHLPSQEH